MVCTAMARACFPLLSCSCIAAAPRPHGRDRNAPALFRTTCHYIMKAISISQAFAPALSVQGTPVPTHNRGQSPYRPTAMAAAHGCSATGRDSGRGVSPELADGSWLPANGNARVGPQHGPSLRLRRTPDGTVPGRAVHAALSQGGWCTRPADADLGFPGAAGVKAQSKRGGCQGQGCRMYSTDAWGIARFKGKNMAVM